MVLPGVRKFPELIEMHSQVVKQFETLNNNINFYNNQPEVAELGFKIISPEEAHKKIRREACFDQRGKSQEV